MSFLGRIIKESIKKHALSRAKRLGMDVLNQVVGRFSSSLSRPAAAPRKCTHSDMPIPSRKPTASRKHSAVSKES